MFIRRRQKMIKGACLLDLYMKESYIFPNIYMEEADKISELKEKEYDIYFILKSDKYVIRQYVENGYVLVINIFNCTGKKSHFAYFDIRSSFRVPDTSYLCITLKDNNSLLKIQYNDKGISYLKDNDSFAYNIYAERTMGGESFDFMIHAKSLVEMQMMSDGIEYNQEYEVLYIGQSKRKNIFDRLKNHSTLQKIMRDNMRAGDNKEIYILLHSVGIKRFVQQDLNMYNASFIFGNTVGSINELDNGIQKEDIVNIAEALLISHFKPEYNDKLKKDDGLEKLSTYRRIGEAEINPIAFSIDLFWEETGEKMVLQTLETKTATKGRYFECYFGNNEVNITYEDVPDCIY